MHRIQEKPLLVYAGRIVIGWIALNATAVRAENGLVPIPIQQIFLNGVEVKPQPGQPLLLQRKKNTLTVTFTNPFPGKTTKFAYRVEPDSTQRQIGQQQTIQLTNLPARDCIIRIAAVDSPTAATAHIELIAQPFWQKVWFWPTVSLLMLTVLGAVMYLFYLYRIRQFLRLQQTRDRIARDLHDDMGSYLSSISIMSRSAANATAKDPERARQSLDKIGETARHVMGAMSDIVWSINPDHDSVDKVVARMQDASSELFSPSGTTVSVEADPAVLTLNLPLEKRHDFFLIYKEAITNAARYSNATQVRIRLHREGMALILVVQDNGQGFDTTQPKARSGGGNGLKNMHVRAGKIGATLAIESELGHGTTVTLQV